MKLKESFFARDTVTVARDLLGRRLVRLLDGERLSPSRSARTLGVVHLLFNCCFSFCWI